MGVSENAAGRIDRLLEAPFWVIDPLPRQVPRGAGGQFAAVEQYWLQRPRMRALREKWTDLLLKLNCYYDFLVLRGEAEDGARNPDPETLAAWIADEKTGTVVLVEEPDMLLTLNGGDLNMTVFHPSEDALALLQALAQAEGLFLWQPPQA